MAYKKLSEATLVQTASDVANVLIEEDDEIKRVPKSEVGGGGGVVKLYAGLGSPNYIYKDAECSQKISKDELNALIGEPVILIFNTSNGTTVSTVPTIGHTVDKYSFCEYATQGNFFMLYTEEYSDIN